MKIDHLIVLVAQVLGLVPIVLFFFSKRKEAGFFYLLTYLIYSLLSDTFINPVVSHTFHKPYLGFRIFTIVEYCLLTVLLYKNIKSQGFKKVMLFISIIFVLYAFFDIFQGNSDSFDSYPSGLECILLIAYCIYFLFEKINEPDSLFLYNTPTFWVVVGLILYFSGTFFLYIYSQNNVGNESFQMTYKFVNSGFNILKLLLISVAFLVKPPKESFKLLKPKSRPGSVKF